MPSLRRSVRPLVLALLVALSPVAAAQSSIEREMTPEQFKAAGLEKLTPAELANLNSWLNRTVQTATTKAATEAKQAVADENRGFFNFGSSDPIRTRITGEFRGFGRGRSYTLENGHVWQQVDDASLAGVRKDSPGVVITPSLIGNAWYMSIEGYNTRAKVERVK